MRRILVAALTGLLAVAALPAAAATAPKAPPPPPAGWVELFADDGVTTDWAGLYRTWGTDGKHTVQNTPDGLRVAGGGTPGNDDQRVVLWLGAKLKGPDFILQYSVRRNDRACPVGTATMLLLAAAGTGKGAVPVPADPAATGIPAPSLTFVDSSLDALRLSTMTAYNPNKAMNAQLRLRRLPGAVGRWARARPTRSRSPRASGTSSR